MLAEEVAELAKQWLVQGVLLNLLKIDTVDVFGVIRIHIFLLDLGPHFMSFLGKQIELVRYSLDLGVICIPDDLENLCWRGLAI